MSIIRSSITRVLFTLALSLSVFSCDEDEGPIRLVFVGDSIVSLWDTAAGFPSMITANWGVSGSRLSDLDARPHPASDVCVVCQIGTNDLQYDFPTPASRQKYVTEYIRVINSLSDNKVYLFSVSPSVVIDRYRNIGWFNDSIRNRLDEMPHVVYLDVYDEFLAPDCKSLKPEYSLDGLHINAVGYSCLEQVLLDKILK